MATITVGTNSYITEAELATYALDRGITISGDSKPLIIRAMDYIETRAYIGTKTVNSQALQFPRILCVDILCEYDNLTVPNEIKKAQCIASVLIGQGYDLQSTLGQSIKREKTGPLETEYQDNTSGYEQHRALNDILRPFIESHMRAVRA